MIAPQGMYALTKLAADKGFSIEKIEGAAYGPHVTDGGYVPGDVILGLRREGLDGVPFSFVGLFREVAAYLYGLDVKIVLPDTASSEALIEQTNARAELAERLAAATAANESLSRDLDNAVMYLHEAKAEAQRANEMSTSLTEQVQALRDQLRDAQAAQAKVE